MRLRPLDAVIDFSFVHDAPVGYARAPSANSRMACATSPICSSVSSGNIGSDRISPGRFKRLREIRRSVSEVSVGVEVRQGDRVVNAGADAVGLQVVPAAPSRRPFGTRTT